MNWLKSQNAQIALLIIVAAFLCIAGAILHYQAHAIRLPDAPWWTNFF